MASLLCGSSRAFVSYCFGRMTFYSWGSPGQFAIFFAADTDFEDQAVACTAGQVEAYPAGRNEAYSAGQVEAYSAGQNEAHSAAQVEA